MQVGSQQSGRVGIVGWRCLPGPSFVCPRRRSRSGLHLPRPCFGHGCSDPSTPFAWRFVVTRVCGGLGIDVGRSLSSLSLLWFGLAGAC